MGELNIKRAIKSARKRGIEVNCSLIAEELWGESKSKTARTNLSNLLNGRTKKINIDAVPYLCERLHCSADFLFGMTDNPDGSVESAEMGEETKKNIRKAMEQINKKIALITKTLNEI